MGIFSTLNKQSLQKKTFFALGMIGGLCLVGMLLGYVCSRTIAHDYGVMLNSNSRLEILSLRIADQMHMVSRDEFAYIMKREQQLIEHRQKALDQVYLDLQELMSIKQDFLPKDQLDAFEDDIKAYQKYFEIITQRLKDEGNADTGMLSELRQAAHKMEKILKDSPGGEQSRIMISYLQIRRHEKDYLARRDRAYIDKIAKEIEQLQKILAVSALKSADRTAFLQGAEVYRDKLSRMDEGYQDLLQQRSHQDSELQNIEVFISKSNDLVKEYNSKQMARLSILEQRVTFIFIGAALLTLLIIFFSAREFTNLTQRLVSLSKIIGYSGEKNFKTSIELQQTSEKTSSAVTEQASAIQETVATINEISAMVGKSVENASISAQKAEMSFHITMEGKKAVDNMRESMNAIQTAMLGMIRQNHDGNQRVAGILSIIEKIADRTNVINDIVFQTKLLSFNASVEAARAGEHGKGFAIVAEEVGNLARMSGEASRAIGELLRNSREQVSTIIQESKEQTEKLSLTGTERVETGVKIANRCDEILSEVVEHVESVKKLMDEISAAAKEEADGIHNITIAMNQLDETTSINSDMAHETMSFSNILSKEAKSLNGAVHELSRIVLGSNPPKATANEADGDSDESDAAESESEPFKLVA